MRTHHRYIRERMHHNSKITLLDIVHYLNIFNTNQDKIKIRVNFEAWSSQTGS